MIPVRQHQGPLFDIIHNALASTSIFDDYHPNDLIIQAFTTGNNNQSFKIKAPNAVFVLRLPHTRKIHQLFKKPYHIQFDNYQAAAKIGISPDILFSDPDTGMLLTPYRGKSLGRKLNQTKIKEISNCLRRLHKSNAAFSPTVTLEDEVLEIFAIADHLKITLPNAIRTTFIELLDQIYSFPKFSSPLRPIHRDPHPTNFLMAESDYYLIDWEHAQKGDPWLDIARLAISNDQDIELDYSVLKSMLDQSPTLDDFECLLAFMSYDLCSLACGFNILSSRYPDVIYYRDGLNRMVQRLHKLNHHGFKSRYLEAVAVRLDRAA